MFFTVNTKEGDMKKLIPVPRKTMNDFSLYV